MQDSGYGPVACKKGQGRSNFEWDAQTRSFAISLALQLCVIVFSVVALVLQEVWSEEDGHGSSSLLTLILILETVVQVGEFVWYLAIAWRFYFDCKSSPVETRYIDWVFTTPTMLLTLLLFLSYLKAPCQSAGDPWTTGFVLSVVGTILADLLMLLFGLGIEVGGQESAGSTPILGPFLLWARTNFTACAVAGFLALAAAFTPHVVLVAQQDGPGEAWALLFVTLAIWTVYGVVATAFADARNNDGAIATANGAQRNTWYNLLDLLSKNALGVLVSIVALNHVSTKDKC